MSPARTISSTCRRVVWRYRAAVPGSTKDSIGSVDPAGMVWAEITSLSRGLTRVSRPDCRRPRGVIELGWVDILVLCWSGHGASEPTNAIFGWSSPCATDNLSQPASFLPPCLMNFGERVIPSATYNFPQLTNFFDFFWPEGFVEV